MKLFLLLMAIWGLPLLVIIIVKKGGKVMEYIRKRKGVNING